MVKYTMKNWFNKLMSRSAEVSSKRFAGLLAFFVCISLVYINTFTPYRVDYYIYRDMLAFSGGCFAFVLAENFGNKKEKQNENNEETTGQS